MELMMTFQKSVNVAKFKVFIEELRSRNPFDDIIVVMDNLSVHRSPHIKERLDELGIDYCYTPAYSPQFNGIEEVWAMGKRTVKQERLSAIQNNRDFDLTEIIHSAFKRIEIEKISNCINKALTNLRLSK
jgi:transposase